MTLVYYRTYVAGDTAWGIHVLYGMGNWDINSYEVVKFPSILTIDRIDNWSFTHSLSSVAQGSLLSHLHVPTLPGIKNA